MFTADKARKITDSNKYKVDSTRNLMLNYMLNRIKDEADKGLSSLELETSKSSDTEVTYSDYCDCVYNLRLARYKVRHFKHTIYISW